MKLKSFDVLRIDPHFRLNPRDIVTVNISIALQADGNENNRHGVDITVQLPPNDDLSLADTCEAARVKSVEILQAALDSIKDEPVKTLLDQSRREPPRSF